MTETPETIMARGILAAKLGIEDRTTEIINHQIDDWEEGWEESKSEAQAAIAALKDAGYEITPTMETLSGRVLAGIENMNRTLEDLGIVIVPVEPTEATLDAMRELAIDQYITQLGKDEAANLYAAAIKAGK